MAMRVGKKNKTIAMRPAWMPNLVNNAKATKGAITSPVVNEILIKVEASGNLILKCFSSIFSLCIITKLAPIPIIAPALKLAKYAPTPPVARYPEARIPIDRSAIPISAISLGTDAKLTIVLVQGSEKQFINRKIIIKLEIYFFAIKILPAKQQQAAIRIGVTIIFSFQT